MPLPEVLTDGEQNLLANGFWGVARRASRELLGEFLMAIGLALPLGYPGRLGPWLYPLYYRALLVPRQLDDARRCALDYEALWQAYVARVPYRIVPGVY